MGVSKQLLPIYDKPMVYYPLTVLMLSGIREIAVITTPEDQPGFLRLLGDGSQWGLTLTYIVQPSPDGLAQAYLLARDFLDGAPSAMVLGDNIFFGHGLPEILAAADARTTGGTVFGYRVSDPERYGVVDFDAAGPRAPDHRKTRESAVQLCRHRPLLPRRQRTRTCRPDQTLQTRASWRLPIFWTSTCKAGHLTVERMGRGFAWLDTGTHGSLLDAGNFVRTLQARQGLQVGCPDEIAYHAGWIDRDSLAKRAAHVPQE